MYVCMYVCTYVCFSCIGHMAGIMRRKSRIYMLGHTYTDSHLHIAYPSYCHTRANASCTVEGREHSILSITHACMLAHRHLNIQLVI